MSGGPTEASFAARLAVVQDLAARFSESHATSDVVNAVEDGVRRGLGAETVILNLVSPDRAAITTLSLRGASQATRRLLRRPVPLDETMPAKAVVDEGQPMFWSSLAERDAAFPGFAAFPRRCAAWAILPLSVHNEVAGVLSLGWVGAREFSPDDVALLMLVAQQCAAALDRARLEEVERAARETLELMSEGTRLMVSDLDPDRVVQQLVALAVPRLAPWCAVYVAEQKVLRRVAIEIAEHGMLAEQLRGLVAVPVDSPTTLARCLRTGETQVVAQGVAKEVRQIYDEPTGEQILASDAEWTALVTPIKTAGQVIGVMSLVSHLWPGAPPPEVRHAAEGLAARAGVALGNARRYEGERLTAALLSEALLPGDLPPIAGYDVAFAYVPAEGRVAGDWFDLLRLPDGRYLLGIGDVGGHGIRAASLMARLRHGARGLAVSGASPTEILSGLAYLTLLDEGESFATATYGLLDPNAARVVWSSAGHLPPLRFGPSGSAYLPFARHPPLGVLKPGEAVIAEDLHLGSSEGLVLCTDGVVERRGASLVAGLEALRSLVEDEPASSAQGIVERVVRRLCSAPEDDCCIVVIARR